MEHLDISQMLTMLRDRPGEFALIGGKLHHRPSRQSFSAGADRWVTVKSAKEWEIFSIDPEQSAEFAHLFDVWKAEYWIPLEINRHFSQDLSPRANAMFCLRRFLLFHHQTHRDSALIIYGNCWAGLRSE